MKRTKINEKEARIGPYSKKTSASKHRFSDGTHYLSLHYAQMRVCNVRYIFPNLYLVHWSPLLILHSKHINHSHYSKRRVSSSPRLNSSRSMLWPITTTSERSTIVRPALVRPALVWPALVRPTLVRPALVQTALFRPALVRTALVRPALVLPRNS